MIIRYKCKITKYDCVKKFLSEIEKIGKEKNSFWVPIAETIVKQGIDIVFTKFEADMWWDVYVAFNFDDATVFELGSFKMEEEELRKKIEENPEFVFYCEGFGEGAETIIDKCLQDLKRKNFKKSDFQEFEDLILCNIATDEVIEENQNLEKRLMAIWNRTLKNCKFYEEEKKYSNLLNEIGVLRGITYAYEELTDSLPISDEFLHFIDVQNEILSILEELNKK